MKKIVSLLLALVMALGLFTAAVAEGNAQVFWYTFSDVYLSSVRTSLDAALTEKGVTFVDQDANATQATQTDQINTAIASGTNLFGCETSARPARTASPRTWSTAPRRPASR